MEKAPKKAGITNVNLPKCVNCLKNLCNAGEINHATHIKHEGGFFRTQCLFECGCVLFEAYKPGTVINGKE